MSEVKQSINKIQICGVLSELNLQMETKEVTLKKGSIEKKVTCKTIGKKEFKNSSLTVEATLEDGRVLVVGGNYYQTHEKMLDDKGNIVDNKRFKALETIIKDYITKVDASNMIKEKVSEATKGTENEETVYVANEKEFKRREDAVKFLATRVKVDGSLVANEYATEQGEFKSTTQINIFQCTSTGVPENDIAEGEISGIIRNIKDETKGGDAEELTGRLEVEFYSFDNQGNATPVKLVVEEDLADDVKEIYKNGDSCKLYYEALTRQIGGKKVVQSGGGFGRRDTKMTSGFTITEFSIFKGEDVYEEENEYFISVDDMKTAMEARKLMIAQKIKEAKEKKDKPKETKTSGLGKRAPKAEHAEEEYTEPCPF